MIPFGVDFPFSRVTVGFLQEVHFLFMRDMFPKFLCSLDFVSEAVGIDMLSDGMWVPVPAKGSLKPWVDGHLSQPEPHLSTHRSHRPPFPPHLQLLLSLAKDQTWALSFLLVGCWSCVPAPYF